MSLSRQQTTLIGIFALFMGPVILVILMRSSWWQYQPAGSKNLGQLIQPPVHLSLQLPEETDGKWLILYALETSCDRKCVENVTSLRQIHRAAGRHRDQLAIVLLGKNSTEPALRSMLESIYPEFQIIADSTATARPSLETVNADVVDRSNESNSFHTYILDPMRNVILAYGAHSNPNDIHKDLGRLLKWSDQENR